MKRRFLSLVAVVAALLVAMTGFAVSALAATNPVWTVPANGTESTHMNTNLNLVGKLSVTSPQNHDLAIFVHANHGKFKSNSNPNNNVCPGGAIADGTFCSYADPTIGQVNWNFRGTLAQVTQALNNVTYIPDLDFPQPANGTLLDSVLISATEQNIALGLTGSTNFEIEVLPPNQAPFFDTIPGAVTGVSTDANQVYDFINDIHITDPGGYTCESTQDAGRTLTVAASGGGTLSTTYVSAGFSVAGNGTALVTFTGSTTDLNNALNLMHYTPIPFLAYTDAIAMHTDDNGCVGYPGALTADGAFPLYVKPLAATHLGVVAPATATNGTPFGITVSALDQYENVDTSYVGTVHLTSTDGAAVLHADATLAAGVGVLSGNVLNTNGNQTITATDTVSAITGTSSTIVVSNPQVATHFDVVAPPTATAGSSFNVTVTAKDAANATVPTYAGTVHITSNDVLAVLPADAMLVAGVGTFNVTLKTAGAHSVSATDTVAAAITGTDSVMVDPGPAASLTATAPGAATNGSAINVHVVAKDAFGNLATTYGGTVHLTSTDAAATLPADAMLSGGAGDFSVTLNTNGNQTVTATDTVNAALTDATGTIVVSSVVVPPATHLQVVAPASATAGSAFNVTVTALDATNTIVPTYSGTVHLTSTDGAAVLPADATLVNGTRTFSVTLNTAGSRDVVATDTVTASITGSDTVVVDPAPPGPATHFSVSAPATATVGSGFTVTVTAQDAANATATGYAGTVHITSSDGTATLPADATLVNGVGTFSVTLNTTGSKTVTATDTVTAAITGTSGAIVVGAMPPGPATHFLVVAPANATAGQSVNVTVTAQDAANATATSYAGTVHITSSDAGAVLPANATLVNGTGTFAVTFTTSGNQTVTATDTVTASINGSDTVSVAAGAPKQMKVSPPPAGTQAGQAFSFTVTVEDQYGNKVTAYSGTIHVSSTDPLADLPADTALVNGTVTLSATFHTTGAQSLMVADVQNAQLAGESVATTILAATTTTTTSTTTPTSSTSSTVPGTTSTTPGTSGASTTVRPTSTTATTGTLPTTGSEAGGLLALAMLLLAGGGLATVTARRRRS